MKTIFFSTKILYSIQTTTTQKRYKIKSLLYSLKDSTLCNNMKQKQKEIGDCPQELLGE